MPNGQRMKLASFHEYHVERVRPSSAGLKPATGELREMLAEGCVLSDCMAIDVLIAGYAKVPLPTARGEPASLTAL